MYNTLGVISVIMIITLKQLSSSHFTISNAQITQVSLETSGGSNHQTVPIFLVYLLLIDTNDEHKPC